MEAICSGFLSSGVAEGLSAGSTATVDLMVSGNGSGSFTPQRVLLDATNTVLESNETNNFIPFEDPACQV